MNNHEQLRRIADTIRVLSADIVQKAGSGHPGMPMGCADYATVLWSRFLRHDPSNPTWLGRDRYVQSAGHGSPLIYSLLHLFDYGLPMSELEQFRQWGSLTPGHPEYGLTDGVEVTTGPLGTGFATGVGMAIGAKQLAARMGDEELFDQRIFVISSDGCMMEGVTHEAASLAGHQRLDNLIVFYDDNSITIEGATSLAFSEDVAKRYEAYGWHVIRVDGHDLDAIDEALATAVAGVGKPVLIVGKTTIGCGAPNKQGAASTHGAPLGEDEVAALKSALGFDPNASFTVPEEVAGAMAEIVAQKKREAAERQKQFEAFAERCPDEQDFLDRLIGHWLPNTLETELAAAVPAKDMATRKSGGAILNRASGIVPSLCGGAADLNPSTNTHLDAEDDFTPDCRRGRNIHFGVREFAMGLCTNGLALYGSAIPFSATFMVFSDFMKPALRLAAIQELHLVNVFTHDSVFVGEDGPTHQPIEQLMMMRAIPGYAVIRPAESNEAAQAWAAALRHDGPCAMCLTRQTVPNLPADLVENVDVAKGAYVLSDDDDPEIVLIATGSEVPLALDAGAELRKEGRAVRVVSIPCWEFFEDQGEEYRESVLPRELRKRVTIEAGITQGWERYAGDAGLMIGIDHFGHSAPYKVVGEQYGLTPRAVAERVLAHFG